MLTLTLENVYLETSASHQIYLNKFIVKNLTVGNVYHAEKKELTNLQPGAAYIQQCTQEIHS